MNEINSNNNKLKMLGFALFTPTYILKIMNIPNILTLIRILLTPLFIILLLKNLFSSALIIFAVAAVTDGLDGFFARYLNQRTVLGSYLDPIADKILLTASFISLAILKIIPEWLTVIVISRDILIVTGIAVIKFSDIKFESKPSSISKCATAFQLFTVFWALLYPEISDCIALSGFIRSLLCWITAGLTIISGLQYIYMGMNILQNSLENKP